jgi:hypothetical protein
VKKSAALSLIVLLGGVIAPNAPPAAAMDFSLESRTYVPAWGIDGGDTHLLFYEYLSLDAGNLGLPGLYVRAGGWGRTDLADETRDRTTNGDLQYGFVGWRGPSLNAEARLGRISFTGGAARNEVFDGALYGTDLPAGFDATLFGGVPQELDDEGGRSGDTLYGGRVSQGRAGLYRVGASYLKEENDGDDAREETCADILLTPVPFVAVTGSSLYDLRDDGWARHDYRLDLGPFAERIRLIATWASTDYRHYFRATTNSAFEEVDAEEQLDRFGGQVRVDLGHGLRLTGDYASYSYDVAESAQAFGGSLDWAGGGLTAGFGYLQMHGDAAEDRYQQFRAYGTAPVGPVAVAAGVEHLAYDEEINGETSATTGTLTVGYVVSKALEVSASAEYGVTPEFEHEASFILAVLWRYDASTKKGGKP